MPQGKLKPTLEEVKALLAEDRDFLQPLVQAVLQPGSSGFGARGPLPAPHFA